MASWSFIATPHGQRPLTPHPSAGRNRRLTPRRGGPTFSVPCPTSTRGIHQLRTSATRGRSWVLRLDHCVETLDRELRHRCPRCPRCPHCPRCLDLRHLPHRILPTDLAPAFRLPLALRSHHSSQSSCHPL